MRNLPAYQPQNNEDLDQIPHQEPQGLKIIIRLLLCLYIIEMMPISGLLHIAIFKNTADKEQLEGPMFKSLHVISTNLKADPLMDIQILNHGYTCPSGFQPLKLANWPGTNPGCLCENGELHDSSCEKVGLENCKRDIPSTYPIDMYEWEYSIWCVKRAVLGADYIRKAECSSGYKECYPGGCFKGECPITKLEITSTGAANKLNNGQDKYVIITRTQGELPLVNIQISLGDIPCWSQGLVNQTIKNSSYELSSVTEKECDKHGLNRQSSTKLDSQTAFEAFTQNYFTYSTTSLPHFEEDANLTISVLSSMTRMKTAKNDYCLNIDEKFAVNYINAAGSAFHYMPLSLIATCILMSLLAFYNLIFESNRSSPEDKKLAVTIVFLAHSVSTLFVIVELGTFPGVYQAFQAMNAYIEGFDLLGCLVGDQGDLVISEYLQIFRKIEARFWVYCVFVVLSGLHIAMLVVFYFTKKRHFRR